jgi:hypothetical protein
MNNKLIDQIKSLTKTFSNEEVSAFRKDAKGNPLYLQLFEIFIELNSYPEEDYDKKVEKEASKIDGEFNNLKENLLKKLIEFVRKIEEEKNREYFEVKNNIEAVNALINRKQFVLANELIAKNYNKIKKIKANGTNYHFFLQYLNQVLEIQMHRYDLDTRSLPTEFENKEVIEWLNRLTQNAANYVVPSINEEASSDFRSNLFFHLLNEYLLLHNNYIELEHHLNSLGNYLFMYDEKRKSGEETLMSFRVLLDLQRLHIAIKLNNPQTINYVLTLMESHSFYYKEKNYQTFIFLMLQIFDFRINIGMDTKQFPLFEKEKDLFNISKKDLTLFTENETEGISLRIEINKGLVLLLSEEYKKAYEQFDSIPLIDTVSKENKFYIKLFGLLSYCLSHDIFNYKVYEKNLEELDKSKFKGSSYSKDFLKLLIDNPDRKNLIRLGNEFLSSHIPVSTFDKVIKHWLTQIQPKR